MLPFMRCIIASTLLSPIPALLRSVLLSHTPLPISTLNVFFVKAVFITTGFLLSAYLYILSVRLENILVKNGFSVTAVCTSGAQALSYADEFHDGIIICGYRLADMICSELQQNIPKGFEILLMASQRLLTEVEGGSMVGLAMPLKVHELISTVSMMSQNIIRRKKKQREKPKQRNEEEAATIAQAKELLMARNNMTEEEAHRYLQKHSMDNSTNMVETAQMVLSMMQECS